MAAGVSTSMVRSALIFGFGFAVSVGIIATRSEYFLFERTPIAIIASALLFFCAGALVFRTPRFGRCLGLAGGASMALWLVSSESALAPETTWMLLTGELNAGYPSPFLALRVLVLASATMAICHSAFSALPALRRTSLSERTWPPVAAGLAASAVWFLCTATPYPIPLCRLYVPPAVKILRAKKSGLRIEQTTLGVTRDGRFYYGRDDHQLLHYRVTALWARGSVPYERAYAFARSPELWRMHTPKPGSLLRSWNAEHWYVLLREPLHLDKARLLVFTGRPPQEVAEFLRYVESLPTSDRQSDVGRDICLGFRLDPLAELGALTPAEKEQLLRLQ